MTRMVKPPPTGLCKVAIADSSGLIFSDDYRAGWIAGFRKCGVEVQVFDVGILSRVPRNAAGPYSSAASSRVVKAAAAAIVKWEPDLVWCHHGRYQAAPGFLEEFSRRGIRTACYLCDEPYECGESVRYSTFYDYVFTIDPSTLRLHKTIRRSADTVFYLPPGADTDHFKFVPYKDRSGSPSCLFLGNASLTPRPDYLRLVESRIPDSSIRYWKTVRKDMREWIPLKDHPMWYGAVLLGLNVHRAAEMGENEFKSRIVHRRRTGPEVLGHPIQTERPAKWGTGFWNDYGLPAEHVNPRFFEFAACGTCVVSDNSRTELQRMFPWTPRADDPNHFVELVKHYLDNQKDAEEIGLACHQEVLKRHTYLHRAAEILTRVGLKESIAASVSSFLGEPKEWLTSQDFLPSGTHQSLGPTGRCATFDPRIGMSLISPSGGPRQDGSLSMAQPWSSLLGETSSAEEVPTQ